MQGAEAELFKALYVACIAVGGFIFALLLSHQHRGRPGNKTLAAFMLFIQVPTLSAYSQLTFGQVPFALQAASQCLILIYGPIIYLLLKAILKPERPVKCAYLHFVPFITIFLLKFLIIPDYGLYVWIPFVILILVYLLVNIRLLITSREQFFQLHSGYKNTTFYWFSFVVGGISVLTVYDIIIISLYLNGIYLGFKWWNIMTFSLCGYLTIVSAFSIWRPTIFYNVLKKKVKSKKSKKVKW
ncbi:hypothetical protein PAUR_b0552 [Pseudoalteromonas aurantia 208]|uniref:Uncharacterized protein n=2 Tax=Pseudoalteromonas aurantia TaxID=43654 RepID=A0ABR9EHN1_9GAMM|nr:hypothetical protein [Pseudoalteromonas aurantia 208]